MVKAVGFWNMANSIKSAIDKIKTVCSKSASNDPQFAAGSAIDQDEIAGLAVRLFWEDFEWEMDPIASTGVGN